jgi:hypothetical protein
MHSSSNGSQPPSQKNEIDREHRITVIEMHAEQHQKSIDQHHERISYLERAVQGLIYATAVLAGIKSDTILDLISRAGK